MEKKRSPRNTIRKKWVGANHNTWDNHPWQVPLHFSLWETQFAFCILEGVPIWSQWTHSSYDYNVETSFLSYCIITNIMGQPYCIPSISPYISCVTEDVFTGLQAHQWYAWHLERWRMHDPHLKFIGCALASWEIFQQSWQWVIEIRYTYHPGLEVLTYLLVASPLQSTIPVLGQQWGICAPCKLVYNPVVYHIGNLSAPSQLHPFALRLSTPCH